MTKHKDKNQSILEFLEALQNEYVIAELRSKIYPKTKDQKYWGERVMGGKEKKIREISQKHNLPNIFSDERVRDVVYDQVIGVSGYPNFTYKNEDERLELEEKDFYNYYSKGSKFYLVNKDQTGYLQSVDKQSGVVTIKLQDGTVIDEQIDNVRRIL